MTSKSKNHAAGFPPLPSATAWRGTLRERAAADWLAEDEAERAASRAQAAAAFQEQFDAPTNPKKNSLRQAMHKGDWGAFFTACCAPADDYADFAALPF